MALPWSDFLFWRGPRDLIASFDFDYCSLQEWDWKTSKGTLKVPLETYAAVRRIIPQLPEDPIEERASEGPYTADVRPLIRLLGAKSIRLRDVYESEKSSLSEIDRLIDKLNEATKRAGDVSFNERCRVHVPGLGLLAMNEVKIMEDGCTNTLQDFLRDGWRIIACCPQPDQRRPDYILGRTVER